MDQVSRPLLAVLAAVAAFFAVWFVALKPGSDSSSPGGTSTQSLNSAVNKARGAVATANAASAAHGGTVPTTPAATPVPSTTGVQAGPSTTKLNLSPSGRDRLDAVQSALKSNKALALLFYNPQAADDRAVKSELATVPGHGGRVFKLAIPVTELTRYPVVTQQVPVTVAPTLVLIDRAQHASTIVGFSDRFEIAQRVSDALSAAPALGKP